MANPIEGAAKGIASARAFSHQSHSGSGSALALVLAIAAAEMLLSGRMQAVWHALWGPVKPLSGGTSTKPASGPIPQPPNASGLPQPGGPGGNIIYPTGGATD